MDRGVAVFDHEIEVPHRGEEVEVAVGFVATAGVVEGVERAVAVEELGGFVDDEFVEGQVGDGRWFPEEIMNGVFCEERMSKGTIRVSVNGQSRTMSGIGGHGFELGAVALQNVDEGDLLCLRNFSHGTGIGRQDFVLWEFGSYQPGSTIGKW